MTADAKLGARPIDAFAHTIDDPRTLAFVTSVDRIAPGDRAAEVSRAEVVENTPMRTEFADALAADCSEYPAIVDATLAPSPQSSDAAA